jgi:DNA-binding NarL/FixJ family response regulator
MVERTRQILLVDDHSVVRDGLRMVIDKLEGLEVAAEAADAQQAMHQVQTRSFDMAIVDIGLPDGNGIELVKRLRALRPNMACLVLSMYSEEIYAVRALRAGASGFLSKRSAAPEVAAAVRKVAFGGRHVDLHLVDRLVEAVATGERQGPEQLSDRELEVLRLIATGMRVKEIADSMMLSPKTVTTYRKRLLEKLGLSSNAELGRYAASHGLMP